MYPTQNFHPQCADWEPTYDVAVFCQADDLGLNWYSQTSLTPAERTTIDGVMESDFEGTELQVAYDPSPDYSASDETDIIFQRGSVKPGLDGMTWCEDALTTLKCDQHYVRFRSGLSFSRGLICHEAGHAVGLTHGDDASPPVSNVDPALGCMRRPNAAAARLGDHNTSMINSTY